MATRMGGVNWGILFPFDGTRRFTRNIVAHSVDALYFVDDSSGDTGQNLIRNSDPVRGHAILAFDDAERNAVFVGSLIPHDADRADRQEHRERLPDLIVPIGSLHFIDDDFISLPKDFEAFF